MFKNAPMLLAKCLTPTNLALPPSKTKGFMNMAFTFKPIKFT